MQYFELTQEEKELLHSVENKEQKSIDNFSEKKKTLQMSAKSAMKKTKNVNVRLTERDLLKIKSKALDEGIPYQTLITSVIHKYVGGKLINVS